MKTDYSSGDVVFMDFETQSGCDLRKMGGRAYVRDPSTRIGMCAFSGRGRKTLWVNSAACPHAVPGAVGRYEVHLAAIPPAWVLGAAASGAVFCAHNALEFDAWVWRAAGLPEVVWRDTLPLCRAAALPGGLDRACFALFGAGKHELGRSTWLSLCVARGGQYAAGTADAWAVSGEYCGSDVDLLEALHREVMPFAEPETIAVHQAVNERGIPIDLAFAARLALLQDELAVESCGHVAEITEEDLELKSVRSEKRVKAWMTSRGVSLPTRDGRPSLDRRDLRKFLEDPSAYCDDDSTAELAAAVLKLRAEATRSTAGKAMRMLSAALEDGRAYWQHVYYGAHTGRFSAREVQPHNFPRGVDGLDPSLARDDLTLAEAKAEAEKLNVSCGDVLSSLLRPCIAGPAVPADYGAVEARGVCWAAGEERQLEMFKDPSADVYVDLARKVYGVQTITKQQRWNAKQAELGCGYGMSGRKFSAMLDQWGVGSGGVTADHVVRTYRREHPRVVAGWKALNGAALAACEGEDSIALCAKFYRLGRCLVMELPSGRKLAYRDARVEMLAPTAWQNAEPRPTVTFLHPRGWRSSLYGGVIMENLVQGLTRDILVDGLARSEAAGFEPFMHVHDEQVVSGADAAELAALVSRPPSWARGFPLLVEAFKADRYFKKPPDGKLVRALDGHIF